MLEVEAAGVFPPSIFVCSANDSAANRATYMRAGADGWLPKGLGPHQMCDRLAEIYFNRQELCERNWRMQAARAAEEGKGGEWEGESEEVGEDRKGAGMGVRLRMQK